ncbi:Kinase, NEK [Giardia muris]|uniref:Kinase, NEK n=1 Tax=Giardia muris TaxID=5742 RepID=A0A4Z1T834_GIAMU|nr:Kinase, NEK [Giardia muris]|eukprot:TNJ30263.1 Kinase, NEK [Giardia muris]
MRSNEFKAKYETLEHIGSGRRSEVYKVRDKKTGEILACKEIPCDATEAKRLEAKFSLLARLYHKSVVEYHETFYDPAQGCLRLIMQWCDKQDLQSLAESLHEQGRTFTDQQLWSITAQVLDAITYLHISERLIHGRIQPSHILVGSDFSVTIIGLEGCQRLSEAKPGLVGIASYAPPEVFRGLPYSPAADIWATACTMYEAITFQTLFLALTPDAVLTAIQRFNGSELQNMKASSEYRNFLRSMLVTDSARRPDVTALTQNPSLARYMTDAITDSVLVEPKANVEQNTMQSMMCTSSVVPGVPQFPVDKRRFLCGATDSTFDQSVYSPFPRQEQPTEIQSSVVLHSAQQSAIIRSSGPTVRGTSTPSRRDQTPRPMEGWTDSQAIGLVPFDGNMTGRSTTPHHQVPDFLENISAIENIDEWQPSICGSMHVSPLKSMTPRAQSSRSHHKCTSSEVPIDITASYTGGNKGGRNLEVSSFTESDLLSKPICARQRVMRIDGSQTGVSGPLAFDGDNVAPLGIEYPGARSQSSPCQMYPHMSIGCVPTEKQNEFGGTYQPNYLRAGTPQGTTMDSLRSGSAKKVYKMDYVRTINEQTAQRKKAKNSASMPTLIDRTIHDLSESEPMDLTRGPSGYEIKFPDSDITRLNYKVTVPQVSRPNLDLGDNTQFQQSALTFIDDDDFVLEGGRVHRGLSRSMVNGNASFLTVSEILRDDKPSYTGLMKAVIQNDLKAVKDLVKTEFGQTVLNGQTALMIAASLGHTKCVRELFPKEGGMRRRNGTTALMEAVKKQHMEIVKILIKKEGGMRRTDGWSCLMFCAQYNLVDLAKLFAPKEMRLQTLSGVTALMIATEHNNNEVAQLLISKEAGLSAVNGWTALMSACENNNTALAEKLASKEAGGVKTDGWTAMMSAARHGNKRLVQLLRKKEAKCVKNDGSCALMWAASEGHREIVQLLAPDERDICTVSGKTACDFAREAGHLDLIPLLSNESGKKRSQSKKK